MSKMVRIVISAIFIALVGCGTQALAEPDADVLSWVPQPGPGEDALVVGRNAILNKLVEVTNERVTIVKFDDDVETGCPILTSLFFSTGKIIELLIPRHSLHDAAQTTVYAEGDGADGGNAGFVIGNASCRYVLTVKRYDRDGDVEKEVQSKGIQKVNKDFRAPSAVQTNDQKIGFSHAVIPLINPSKLLDFTGIASFAPTTFMVYLANADKDIAISSESNFLTRAYKLEIKNAQAALRISINREFYSKGQWVNAFGK
jgi:hypothetical protein